VDSGIEITPAVYRAGQLIQVTRPFFCPKFLTIPDRIASGWRGLRISFTLDEARLAEACDRIVGFAKARAG
jgi:hypothetical protein